LTNEIVGAASANFQLDFHVEHLEAKRPRLTANNGRLLVEGQYLSSVRAVTSTSTFILQSDISKFCDRKRRFTSDDAELALECDRHRTK
jgi:hypothetical protein